jgi:hypothetical protein
MVKSSRKRKQPDTRNVSRNPSKKRKQPNTSHYSWVGDHVAAASLAYKDDHISDINEEIKLSEKWEYLKSVDGASGCRVKIWVSKTNGNILCGFRGTQSLAEAKLDADFALKGFKTQNGESIGNIHRGFERGFSDIKDQLDNELRIMKDFGYLKDGAVLQFAGHSLGGALSDIASTYYAGMFPTNQVISTTLGAPMTGDKSFAEYSKSLPNLNRTRIISDTDPVARTPLPGMQHIEKNNVIDFRTRKKSKSIAARLVEFGKEIIGGASAGIQLAISGKDLLDSHGLDYYTKVLASDFKENRVDSPNAQLERDIQTNEVNYERSKESKEPVPSGGCRCDCHYHDMANEKGIPPPQSTGAIEEMEPANTENMETSDSLQVNDTQNTFQQSIQRSVNAKDLLDKQKTQQAISKATSDEIMSQINEALEAQKEKEKKELQKLQDRYASLTNQTEEDLDDISKERQSFQKDLEDTQYFEQRIQYELDHPEYVKEDGYDSKTKAVAFKNRMNKLYALINSAASQSYVQKKQSPSTQPDQDDIERIVADDQAEQAQGAETNKNLNPDDQSGPWIFDVTKLSDLDTDSAAVTKKQIQEWLTYPDMKARDLFDILKGNFTQEYREERMTFLRQKEQDTRKSAAEKIKAQIENYSNVQGTGTYDKLNQSRQKFFTDLSTNPKFQQMLRDNQVDMKALVSKFQKENDEVSILSDLFGYDEKSSKAALEQAYTQQLMSIPTDIPIQERQAMMQEAWKQYNLNKQYPWIKSDKMKGIYDKYKDDPQELSKQLDAMKPTVPSSYATDPDMVMEQTGFNAKLLQQNVQALTDNSKEIVQQDMVDYYQQFRAEQLKDFADPNKLQQLFKSWNPEKSFGQKVAGEAKDLLTLYTTRHGGWYDKEGKFLGATASPDFEDYVRNNPDAGFKYVPTQEDDFMSALWDIGGEAIGMRYGINPAAGIDKLAGGTGDLNNDGVVDSKDTQNYDDEPEIFNPMAAMMMGGGDDNNPMQQQQQQTSKTSKKSKFKGGPMRGARTGVRIR